MLLRVFKGVCPRGFVLGGIYPALWEKGGLCLRALARGLCPDTNANTTASDRLCVCPSHVGVLSKGWMAPAVFDTETTLSLPIFAAFRPRHVDRRNCCQLTLIVARSLHWDWPSTFIYNMSAVMQRVARVCLRKLTCKKTILLVNVIPANFVLF